jgi:hypothetical protein
MRSMIATTSVAQGVILMELLDGMTLKHRIGGDKVVHVEGHYGIAFRCS